VDSYDPRWGDDLRDRDDNCRDLRRGSRGGSDPRDRERVDPRDVFMEHVNLPRGLDREHVHYHGHDYTLRGSETRTLTTVGAFRAVPAQELRDAFDPAARPTSRRALAPSRVRPGSDGAPRPRQQGRNVDQRGTLLRA
jgi:hypothetical protein